jgi:hypothetical protein
MADYLTAGARVRGFEVLSVDPNGKRAIVRLSMRRFSCCWRRSAGRGIGDLRRCSVDGRADSAEARRGSTAASSSRSESSVAAGLVNKAAQIRLPTSRSI